MLKSQSLQGLILGVCLASSQNLQKTQQQQQQQQRLAKPASTNSTAQQIVLQRNDKFNQNLLTVMHRHIQLYLQAQNDDGGVRKDEERKSIVIPPLARESSSPVKGGSPILSHEETLNSLISEQTKKEIKEISPSQIMTKLYTKDEQSNWLRISETIIALAIESLKGHSSALGPHSMQMLQATFDLFKVAAYFICLNLLTTPEQSELFNDNQETIKLIKQASDLVTVSVQKCPLIQLFQTLFNLARTDNRPTFEAMYQEFVDMSNVILDGKFERVDRAAYIDAVYMTFLDKLITTFDFSAKIHHNQAEGPLILLGYLSKYFRFNIYPENRLKDIETQDFLRNRQAYRQVLGRFKQLEMRKLLATQVEEVKGIPDQRQAISLVNKAFVQQQAFDLIAYFAFFIPKVADNCFKQITAEVQNDTSYTSSFSRLYQYMKLALLMMTQGSLTHNKNYYDILIAGSFQSYFYKSTGTSGQADDRATEMLGHNDSPKTEEFKTWSASNSCKYCENFGPFWVALSNKVKTHLIAKAQQLRQRQAQNQTNTQSSKIETVNNLLRTQNSTSQMVSSALLSEVSFNILKKMFVYGTFNLDLIKILYPPMKEIIRDVKDFEHSFEVKLAVYSYLVISKDNDQGKQEEILKFLTNLLKQLLEYITIIDVKYGSQKPPGSSSRRQAEGELSSWDQERNTKIKQIQFLVGQAISIVSNYIDFKVNPPTSPKDPHALNESMMMSIVSMDQNRLQSNPIQLDMITKNRDTFDAMVSYLKKIVLRSNMHGGYLVEQMLRIYFFPKVELQNLCLIQKNSGNELLLDIHSSHALDKVFSFVVDATETMAQNAHSMVRNFVQVLHSQLINLKPQVVGDGISHLQLVRFAKGLQPQTIKQLKNIMIFIREKEESMKDTQSLLKDLIVKVLCACPRTLIYKEFFTFFREIFYYNKDMDKVDFELACDTLQIMNQVLETSSRSLFKETIGVKGSAINQVSIQDYFMFSDLTPGVILSENFKVPQDSFSISLMFKLNLTQIKALQEQSGGSDDSSHTVTFFQIIDKTNQEQFPPFLIIINIFKDTIKIYDYEAKLDESWHLLLVQFVQKKTIIKSHHKIKIYIDSLQKPVNPTLQHTFHKNHEHIFAYGCDAKEIMAGMKMIPAQSQQISVQMSQIQNNNFIQNFRSLDYFHGCLSMPFMLNKFELDKIDKQNDQLRRCFTDFLIESITKKLIVNVGTNEFINYLKLKGKIPTKENQLPSFESHDFNEEVIIKHQRGCSIDHLATVHAIKPQETIVVLGGFKMLYPILEKSMRSNLTNIQKSEIWRHLFVVLRTLMNVEPSHVLRLYKSKFLIQSIRSCLIRGGLSHHLITKDLLDEVFRIAKDANTNKQSEVLEEFYRKYVFDVILNETFCDLTFFDLKLNRRAPVFEEVAETLYQMYLREESQREKYESKYKNMMIVSGQIGKNKTQHFEQLANISTESFKEFFTIGTAKEIYKLLMKLVERYTESEYIKHTKKIAVILMRLILRDHQKENFTKLLESVQMGADSKRSQTFTKATLLALLKIIEGVIKNPQFNQSHELFNVLKQTYKRESFKLLLNQTQNLTSKSEFTDGTIEDDIIAVTLRIIIDVQIKLQDQPRQIMPPRQIYISTHVPSNQHQDESRSAFINDIFRSLSQNPRGIQMQKTVCSLIICAIEKKQKLKVKSAAYTLAPVKYNPRFLRDCMLDRSQNNFLEIMNSPEFDSDLFGLTIKLFKWYEVDTKLVVLDFYRQLIEETNHNIDDFSSFKNKNFFEIIQLLQNKNLETYILNIVNVAMKSSDQTGGPLLLDSKVLTSVEQIVSSLIKCFFNTSLMKDIEGMITDEEFRFLKTIKKLFIILEPYQHTLLSIVAEVLKYVQEVVKWVWSYVLHDTNRTNLNLKLILFLQLLEEVFLRKLNQTSSSKQAEPLEYEGGILNVETFYEVMARLMIIFEDTKILYFDYPNPHIIETNKRNTMMMTTMIRNQETFAVKQVTFLQGGPFRIFLSLFLQIVRKLKPSSPYAMGSSRQSSEDPDSAKSSKKEGGGGGDFENQVSFDHFSNYDQAIELFRYYLFNEDSTYLAQFRVVPKIEIPSDQSLMTKAPLFKIMFAGITKKRSQFVLQPVDLTRHFIEGFNEFQEPKDSVTETLGFLPLILISEFFEILKRKCGHLKLAQRSQLSKKHTANLVHDYQSQIVQLLSVLFEVLKQAYVSDEIKESIGYIMMTITHPQLKEEIYGSLARKKSNVKTRDPTSSSKPFYLAKTCEFFDRSPNNHNMISTFHNISDSAAGEGDTGKNEVSEQLEIEGLRAAMKDGYFRQSARTDQFTSQEHYQQAMIDNQLQYYQTRKNLKEQEAADEGEQFFTDADLDPIKKAEEKERYETTKDHPMYQEDVMRMLNNLFQILDTYFNSSDGQETPDNLVNSFKETFLQSIKVEEIINSIRTVSSEKFRDVHVFGSISKILKEEQEIQRQIQIFLVLDKEGDAKSVHLKREIISPLKRKDTIESEGNAPTHQNADHNGMNDSQYSLSSLKGVVAKTAAGRKRSADETSYDNELNKAAVKDVNSNGDEKFEFQGMSDNPISLGKVSMSSSNRPQVYTAESQMQISSYSLRRLPGQDAKSVNNHRTLEYYYCRQQYRKTVNTLMEEPSSIWYDNLEQIKKDYADMKEIYDIINSVTLSAEDEQLRLSQPQGDLKSQEEQKQKYANQAPSSGFKPKQYDHFVKLRKVTDLWGRSLLLKPDRKYKQRKFLVSHKYFVHDILKNLFAVAMLEDGDFADYHHLLQTLEQQEQERELRRSEASGEHQQENPQLATDPRTAAPHSEQFKRLRELLMSRIEQNDFLYSLLTNPDEFMNDDKPFEDHPITKKQDPSIIKKIEVQYITVSGAQLGDLYLSEDYLMFKSKPERINDDVQFALKKEQVIKKKNKIWQIGSIEQIFKRRFLLLHQACEFFTKDKKSYFFNLLTEEQFSSFFEKLTHDVVKPHNRLVSGKGARKIEIIENPKNEFKKKQYVEDWIKGEKSTQEFLLMLNKYSGRSFNDFGQYPIFPWIVSDYECSYEELKLKTEKLDGEGFRDLTKNTGILSDKKLEVAQAQFDSNVEGDEMIYGDQKYHLKFGFSNRILALGYLLRMEPFTDNFIMVNGGLDNPDRIFYSFKEQWRSVLDDKQNNAELIPEVFYLPEIFRNHNLSFLGKSRTGVSVNEVELPGWAKNEHDFVRVHRECLESKHVARKLRYWVDLLFGSKQKDESNFNVFFGYAYESYVRSKQDEIEPHNIDTILEFMQVPLQLFTEPLFKLDKKQQQQVNAAHAMLQSQQLAHIPEDEEGENDYETGGDRMRAEEAKYSKTPMQSHTKSGADQRIQSSQIVALKANRLVNKISGVGAAAFKKDHRTARESDIQGAAAAGMTAAVGGGQDFKNSSLISKFIECAASVSNKRYESELKKIQESHKIDKPEDRNIFHMAFSQLNGRCFVFLADKESGSIKCVACRESFLQEELRNPCNLGLKLQNLRGDFHNIFQLYGGGLGDKNASSQKSPLLFTCQNMDNTIKIYDLSIKKGPQLVHQERNHNNVVTSIKFTQDFKYFISGDQDGVIHYYQRTVDSEAGNEQELSATVIQTTAQLGRAAQTSDSSSHANKCFPFNLKLKFQDQYGAIIAIDTNQTLDMYATASRDGTIGLRCLRSSQLFKVITLEKLQQQSVEVLTLKISLHGYIIIMLRGSMKVYTFVYSLNGDMLVSTQRESDQFEFKYAQLTQNEDNMIMVFNQRLNKTDKDLSGVIRVSRLYDMDKDKKRDNLERTFYPMIHQVIYGIQGEDQHKTKIASRRTPLGLSENLANQKYIMPAVTSFALSQDESKMNLILRTGEIICFDESRSQIIQQLDDFGLA